ncbi:MAG: LysM peptidoglycan-binding domain-containing protein [Anaerolineales bacterium]|nr:LysM peptidoglycan-binding domain-containing protein [Anaerolineales bacterium]
MSAITQGAGEPQETGTRKHVVQAGETLSGIVQKYYGAENANRWVELHAYNRKVIGENPDVLVLGTELEIPILDELLNYRPGFQTHVVQPGESLSMIARLYYGPEQGAHWITLYNNNRATIGEDPNQLSVGMELIIPDLTQFL